MDPRFAKKLAKDPRFKAIPKKEFKVEIDSRFKNVFKSDKNSSISIDKRGRKINEKKVENDMKKYYNLNVSDNDNDHDDGASLSGSAPSMASSDTETDTDIEDAEDAENSGKPQVDDQESDLDDTRVDFARGDGGVESSDEESDTSLDEDVKIDDLDEIQGPWAEEDIPTGEETNRFACVNLDWDHVKAKDLYKVFDAFTPAYGTIKSVSIYPSEFGKDAMAKEALHGPPTSVFKSSTEKDSGTKNSTLENDEGKDFNMVALRKYQIDRLKYYYAVIECDSLQCAKTIFNACDGAEFESSANFFDLRYIPNTMSFDEDIPRDVAREAPISYAPIEFTTQALQHSKVSLTWDQDDVERQKTTRKKFSKQEIQDMDFKAYLASSSDEEDEIDQGGMSEEMKKKYRELLVGDGNDEGEESEHDMEITFAPGLSEKAAKKLQEKKEREMQNEETVFETSLRKQKEKKKAKKSQKKEDEGAAGEQGDLQEVGASDEFDDPFFQSIDNVGDEFSNGSEQDSGDEIGLGSTNELKSSKNSQKKNKKQTKEERLAKQKEKEQLQLLIMDDQSTSKATSHFSAKDVIKSEKSHKSRKMKKKVSKMELDAQDDFKLDLKDPRFKSLLDDHQFFIDPTNPQFKSTTAMKEILSEKRKSRANEPKQEYISKTTTYAVDNGVVSSNNPALLKSLVDSVKRKNDNQKENGKRSKLV